MKLVLTCEHAGNLIPSTYAYLFAKDPLILDTHRGYDPGAFDLFEHLKDLATFHKAHMQSRLLIEMNRSTHHPDLFSTYTRSLSSELKKEIIHTFYLPYRTAVESSIKNLIEKGEVVLHLSIHSFTPILDGETRNADIGLLYDPAREAEKEWCKNLKRELQIRDKLLRIRANYPYKGTSDGFTTNLRKIFPENYLGIEIEVNQNYSVENKMDTGLKKHLFTSIEKLIS